MAKRLVASIEKRLRQVLIPRDSDAAFAEIDVARGNIELRDVKINEEFLQKRSSLPFMIRDSTIRRVSVHFPLKALLAKRPGQVRIEGVSIVLAPREDLTLEQARSIFRDERQRAIAAAELWAMSLERMDDPMDDDDGKDATGARAYLRAALKRATQQALHNAAVTIENVHIRYECQLAEQSHTWVACGITVLSATVGGGYKSAGAEVDDDDEAADPPTNRDTSKPTAAEGGRRSVSCTVRQFGMYCETKRLREATAASCLPPSHGADGMELQVAPTTTPARRATGAPSHQTPLQTSRPPVAATPASPRFPTAPGPAANEPRDAFGVVLTTYMMQPWSFDLLINSQLQEALDFTMPERMCVMLPPGRSRRDDGEQRALVAAAAAAGTPLGASAPASLSSSAAAAAAPWEIRLDASTQQLKIGLQCKRSLQQFMARQRYRLSGRPRPMAPPKDGPSAREWWQYIYRCAVADRKQATITTEISGYTWSALYKVLRMRKRYLQLHRIGRYKNVEKTNIRQRRLTEKEVEELLEMEELLELDTILLFRRFVAWQMQQLHGAAAVRDAYVGSDIDDLRGPLAEELDATAADPRAAASEATNDAAFEVEALRHIVQVATGKRRSPSQDREGARAAGADNDLRRRRRELRLRRRSGDDLEVQPPMITQQGSGSSPAEMMRQTRLMLLQQLRDATTVATETRRRGSLAATNIMGRTERLISGVGGGGGSGDAGDSSFMRGGGATSPLSSLSGVATSVLRTISREKDEPRTDSGEPGSAQKEERSNSGAHKEGGVGLGLSRLVEASPTSRLPSLPSPLDAVDRMMTTLRAPSAPKPAPPPPKPEKLEEGEWEMMWAQDVMYEKWRQLEPDTVRSLEALTAAVMRDAKTTRRVHQDYVRLSFECSAPLRAVCVLRSEDMATGRPVERLRYLSDQFCFRARRTQGDRTQLEWLFGPVSVAMLPSKLMNKARMYEVARKRLDELRVREKVRAVLYPRSAGAARGSGYGYGGGGGGGGGLWQDEVDELLGERRGLLSLQFTKEAATALWQEVTPHISLRVAPELSIEAYPLEDFRLLVPASCDDAVVPPSAAALGRAQATATAAAAVGGAGIVDVAPSPTMPPPVPLPLPAPPAATGGSATDAVADSAISSLVEESVDPRILDSKRQSARLAGKDGKSERGGGSSKEVGERGGKREVLVEKAQHAKEKAKHGVRRIKDAAKNRKEGGKEGGSGAAGVADGGAAVDGGGANHCTVAQPSTAGMAGLFESAGGALLATQEGAAMWDTLHGQSVWELLSAASRPPPPPTAASNGLKLGLAGGGAAGGREAAGALTRRGSAGIETGANGRKGSGLSGALVASDGGGGAAALSLIRTQSAPLVPSFTPSEQAEAIAAALSDSDTTVRLRAVHALARLEAAEATPYAAPLARCLNADDSALRQAALGVLSTLPAAALAPHAAALVAQLDHPDPQVRAAALDAVGAMHVTLPTLVVPESALVVGSVLRGHGRARGVFCYVDAREGGGGPGGVPFVFVPTAGETRRMPGALGWVRISYDPELVHALGAGELHAGGAARLRSIDVVRVHEHAEQLLREFDKQRRDAAQRRLELGPSGGAGLSSGALLTGVAPAGSGAPAAGGCCSVLFGCLQCLAGLSLLAGGSVARRDGWIDAALAHLAEAAQRCLQCLPRTDTAPSSAAAVAAAATANASDAIEEGSTPLAPPPGPERLTSLAWASQQRLLPPPRVPPPSREHVQKIRRSSHNLTKTPPEPRQTDFSTPTADRSKRPWFNLSGRSSPSPPGGQPQAPVTPAATPKPTPSASEKKRAWWKPKRKGSAPLTQDEMAQIRREAAPLLAAQQGHTGPDTPDSRRTPKENWQHAGSEVIAREVPARRSHLTRTPAFLLSPGRPTAQVVGTST